MQIKIPINRRELTEDGKIINNPGEIIARIDMTVRAEERWETHFPRLAEKETVFAYLERIQKTKQTAATLPGIVISSIKALYCFLLSDDLPNFDVFAALFDLSDPTTTERQVKVLDMAFTAIKNGSSTSQKNY